MVKNDVSFILSFVILMAEMWIFGFFPKVCPTEPSNLVSSLGCLVSNRRQALLGGIRLGSSATVGLDRRMFHDLNQDWTLSHVYMCVCMYHVRMYMSIFICMYDCMCVLTSRACVHARMQPLYERRKN